MNLGIRVALTALFLAPVYPVSADVLLIERTEKAAVASVPKNGLTMAQVEAHFGAPSEKLAPVAGYKRAHPAITRWRYADYTVYFENQRVINTVLNSATPVATGHTVNP